MAAIEPLTPEDARQRAREIATELRASGTMADRGVVLFVTAGRNAVIRHVDGRYEGSAAQRTLNAIRRRAHDLGLVDSPWSWEPTALTAVVGAAIAEVNDA